MYNGDIRRFWELLLTRVVTQRRSPEVCGSHDAAVDTVSRPTRTILPFTYICCVVEGSMVIFWRFL